MKGIEKKIFAGVDFGSKTAGTTAVFFIDANGKMQIHQSAKLEDADSWLLQLVDRSGISQVFIDAPLSLPGVYFGKGDDYFYRQSDRELACMSPMFLGGLTARAMKLSTELEAMGVQCFETYPAALARAMQLKDKGYKKSGLTDCVQELKRLPVWEAKWDLKEINNWHRFDALMAWITAKAILSGGGEKVGDPNEGQIYVYRPLKTI